MNTVMWPAWDTRPMNTISWQGLDLILTNGTTCEAIWRRCRRRVDSLYTRRDGEAIENLSVTLFKRTGVSGAYSVHGKCKMYNTSGSELPYTNYSSQRRYNVDARSTSTGRVHLRKQR